jgi:hypothetical protein
MGQKSYSSSILILALYECKWSDSRSGHFIPAKEQGVFNRKSGGPQIRSERCREVESLLPLPGIEPQFLGYPVHSLVTILK